MDDKWAESVREFRNNRREVHGSVVNDSKLSSAGSGLQQIRPYSTSTRNNLGRLQRKVTFGSSIRTYATTTNPNPPFGIKNASNSKPAKVALIGKLLFGEYTVKYQLIEARGSRLHWSSPDRPSQHAS